MSVSHDRYRTANSSNLADPEQYQLVPANQVSRDGKVCRVVLKTENSSSGQSIHVKVRSVYTAQND